MGNLFAFGNSKLPRTTAIFNLGPSSNGAKGAEFKMQCPEYLRGTCQLANPLRQCYAVKAERQYVNVRLHRQRQRRFWYQCTANSFVSEFQKARKRTTKALRFNESGGIANEADIAKLADIARLMPDVTVYLYTSRRDLWEQGAFDCLPSNVTVNGSGFMAHNAFRARPESAIPKDGFRCPMDCRICDLCTKRQGADIYAAYH